MISFPYTSVPVIDEETGKITYDRASNSEEQCGLNDYLYTDGVDWRDANAFKVVAGTGMTVNVLCNKKWVKVGGHFGFEPQEIRTIQCGESDTTNDKIITIVARNDNSQSKRKIDLYFVDGTPGTVPEMPAPVRTATIQEIVLASVYIPKNTTEITNDRISDKRMDAELCGMMTLYEAELDYTPYFLQFEAMMVKYGEDFNDWFDEIKGQLTDDAAGALQLEIDTINNSIGDINELETNSKEIVGAINEVYSSSQSGVQTSSSTTTFNEDGSITTEYANGNENTTTFNSDGTITDVFIADETTTTSTTVFNADGSISVNITQE